MSNYMFQPLHWIDPKCPNRLSTCRGKHFEEQFGNMSRTDLILHFENVCKYDVIVLADSEKYKRPFPFSYNVRNWAAKNIKGFWLEICLFNYQDMVCSSRFKKHKLKLFDFCFSFQNSSDAILFKMVWL